MADGQPANANGLDVGFGAFKLGARGPLVIIVILAAVIVAGGMWGDYRLETSLKDLHNDIHADHVEIGKSIDVQTCLSAFSVEERAQLRLALAKAPGGRAGSFQLLLAWCPWLTP